MGVFFAGFALADAAVTDITKPTASKILNIFFIFIKRHLIRIIGKKLLEIIEKKLKKKQWGYTSQTDSLKLCAMKVSRVIDFYLF